MISKTYFGFVAALVLSAIIAAVAATTPGASADGDDDIPSPPAKEALTYPNLGSHLSGLVDAYEQGSASQSESAGQAAVSQGGSVAVTIYLTRQRLGVVQFLQDNGGDPRNVGEDYIEAYVPVSLLGAVSEQPGVIRVREIIPPQPEFGPITSQGVAAHLASPWHTAGYSGQGIKVGIIDSFEGIRNLMGRELPATVVGRCYTDVGRYSTNLSACDRDSSHGTGVAEAVMDIAPEVSLYIANPGSRADLQSTTDWMVSQGVSVINRSQSYYRFDGPGDGTSWYTLSEFNAINQAVEGGIIWVNSAGNYATETWFSNSPVFDTLTIGTSSFDFLAFDGSIDIDNGMLGYGEDVVVILRWDDSWGVASSDLDLLLWDTIAQTYVARSEDYQTGLNGQIPLEIIGHELVEGRLYEIVVIHRSGRVPGWVQVMARGGVDTIEHHTGNGSINNPSESANLGMLAVGASHYWDTNTIAPYSSQGPTPDGRVKPDIVGTACAHSASYELLPPRVYGGNCWFPGTSQAAPHVAGLAALVKQANPSFTPEQVADYLRNNAAERGDAGPDNTWGYGFAELPAPVEALPTIVFDDMNHNSAQLQNRIARYIVENGYGYPTSLESGATSSRFQGLRNGDIDVAMEVWLPQIQGWEEALEAGEVLSLGASLGNAWESAFVIPAYLQVQYPELDHVQDLKEQQYQALFATPETGGKARLVSCVIGWSCERSNSEQIEGYGLSDHVHIVNPGSEAAMNADLYVAYERGEPWLGYRWSTSEPALLRDLVRLEEPEYSDECWRTTKACAYEGNTVLIGVNSGLPDRAPEVAEFLRQWDFNIGVHLRNITRWQAANPNASIEDAAFYWLIGNIDTWSGWVTDEAAARILSTLNKDALNAAPASGRIAFQSERDGNSEIYVMSANGSGVARLTNNSFDDLNPAWSPDGTRIAFASQRDGNSEVYVMNADGSGVIRLTNNSAWDFHPSWSPDGQRIAFFSERDGNYEVYVMNVDGSDVTRLTNNSAADGYPAWSPDGRHIAFASQRDGNYEIYTINADGSDVTRLTNNSALDYSPAWSATVTGTPTQPAAASATRSFSPAASVAPGGTLTVTIDVADYGPLGTITETLPDGFSYLSSTHNSVIHPVDGNSQMVRFTLLGHTSVAYTVTASDMEGTHTFSGTLTDSGMNIIPVGGDNMVTVGDLPLGVTLSYAGTTPAAPVRMATPIPVSATFTNTVTGFTVDDVSVGNGMITNFSGSNAAYTFDVTPNDIGQVTVDIAANVAQDSDGNENTAARQLPLGIPYDDNRNDTIELDEALAAVDDYFSQVEGLTLDHVYALIDLFFGG